MKNLNIILIFFIIPIIASCKANYFLEKQKGGSNTKNGPGPMVGYFDINNQRPFTFSNEVDLIHNIKNAHDMRFSNDNEYWSDWEKYADTTKWKLDSNKVKHTVFAEYRNEHYYILKKSDSISFFKNKDFYLNDGDKYSQYASSVSFSSHANVAAVSITSKIMDNKKSEELEGTKFKNRDSVIIYRWNGEKWKKSAQLFHPHKIKNSNFGYSVAVSGDSSTVAISSSNDIGGTGAVYLYRWIGKKWLFEKEFIGPRGKKSDKYGNRLILSYDGNNLFVSATGSNNNRGSVYIYNLGEGQWFNSDILKHPHGKENFFFGKEISLSIDSSTVAIGSYTEYELAKQGIIFIYKKKNKKYKLSGKLFVPDEINRYNFGNSFDLSNNGSTLITGAPAHENTRHKNQGTVFIYKNDGNNWKLKIKKQIEDQKYYSFGEKVSISDDGLISAVSLKEKNKNYKNGNGTIVIYKLNKNELEEVEIISDKETGNNDQFGRDFSLSSGGNVIGISSIYESINNFDIFGSGKVSLYKIDDVH